MTFEEVKEMINSTIAENGQRQITGKALNLALTEMLTALEEYFAEFSPDVAGVETVYFYDDMENLTLTEAHQAHNAEVVAKCAAAVAAGEPLPAVQADLSAYYSTLTTVPVTFAAPPVMSLFVEEGSDAAASTGLSGITLYSVSELEISMAVTYDGSVSIIS